MTAAIFCKDAMGFINPKPIETFTFLEEKEVSKRLKELQLGYHEKGDDAPKVKKGNRNGKRIIWAYSDATDFFHIAYIGMKIKEGIL